MSAKRERAHNLSYLGDDILFKIFVKCHPKTVGRLRTLSKAWSKRLQGKEFVEQNWKENEDRNESVIIAYGYTDHGEKSHWGVGVNVDSGVEMIMELPVSTVQHGFFTIIGSERGNLCARFSDNGEDVGVMVWNPVTKHVAQIDDKVRLHVGSSVSVYGFGYLDESWEYRVMYLYKKLYDDHSLYWYMWNSIHRCWNTIGNYPTGIKKVGPTYVAVKGVIYWIGWGGFFNLDPTHVIGFSLNDANFFEDEIPVENVLSFHRICKFKEGLGFISYADVGLDREVNVEAQALSKLWSQRLKGKKFVEQNWRENEGRADSVVVGYGYTCYPNKTHWCIAVNAYSGEQVALQPPVKVAEFGYFTVIGSDKGNVCIRCTETGEAVRLIVWNPVTKAVADIEDQARNFWTHSVSVYAFGYLNESWEYRVLYLYKNLYRDSSINWVMWNSIHRSWNQFGEHQTQIRKVGPTFVVVRGVVYFIGWGGSFNLIATHVIGFSLADAAVLEEPIPAENRRTFHTICNFKKGLGFIAHEDVGLEREVNVWSLSVNDDKKFTWEKTIHIGSFGIPYLPNILIGKDFLSLLDTRSTCMASNDEQRTEVLVSKRKNTGGDRSIIYHEGWQMSVFVKSHTMHRDGLFDV
ncbi:hypothetical protein PIB30_030518 [Stylosanthes scabra]|uniref:F-box domain-containing protein n=1 Tax=Stylosanthes scabra TaxID=79078 RepID=A0ABU6Y9Z3_9FABA|nr:hypothetical protein [Stylosanthes scabra]